MNAVAKFFAREQTCQWAEEARAREFATCLFTEWRDRYVANLCGYIRVYGQARLLGITLPAAYRSPAWCNAAVHILTVADLGVQDFFLRAAPAVKDRLVEAVLDDGGIENLNGFFEELPYVR